ncbi:hypothetical protein ATE92_0569 [Ulvibacter sp. MAR_2010_11]|uniref:hypothetical protein n=1 Tax=Ulvibacter sp. MAR_2010_11 TaxID=1250229 RepID=UPI000C2CCF0E|nr:hypothetical protein [Ulvibacter sp. MAR_2010_11]PKA82440.1 hypothetical protein ATE92_0569 [Ulvibacter sp. MAR_2010_11]
MMQNSTIQNKLLEKLFEQALSEGAQDNPHGLATHIHNEMDKRSLKPPTPKTISTYYQKLEDKEVFTITRHTLDAFSKYLDFIDYNDFIKRNSTETSKRCLYVIIILLGIIAFLGYENFRKKCMRWEEDRFVRAHCDEDGITKFDPGLYHNFKKLKAQCDKTFFFNTDGSPKVWYYKRGEKDLELFSSSGVHPLKRNDLRKINVEMIKKHICPDFKGS